MRRFRAIDNIFSSDSRLFSLTGGGNTLSPTSRSTCLHSVSALYNAVNTVYCTKSLFSGVYLPLLWQPTFCFRTPLALGYTRGHFSALVSMEVDLFAHLGARANIDNIEDAPTVYLPLMDNEGKNLPIHFLQSSEVNNFVLFELERSR